MFSANITIFCQNNPLSTQNLSKNACFYSFSVLRCRQHGGCQRQECSESLFRILFKGYITCFRRIPAGSCSGYDIAIDQSGVVDVALQRDVVVG